MRSSSTMRASGPGGVSSTAARSGGVLVDFWAARAVVAVAAVSAVGFAVVSAVVSAVVMVVADMACSSFGGVGVVLGWCWGRRGQTGGSVRRASAFLR